MDFRPFSFWGRTLLAGCATLLGATVVLGQSSTAAPAAAADQSTSRMDVFTGYSYIAPHGTVYTPEAGGTVDPLNYSSINLGAIGSFAYYFNRYVGGQVEYANHPNGMNDGAQTAQGGIIFRYPTEGMAVFVHALGGGVRLGGPNLSGAGLQPKHIYTWGPALTVGAGMDYDLPFGGHRIAWRIFQGDYEYWHADFGEQVQIGGRANVNAVRLSTGLLWHFGSIAPPPPVQYACAINPASVFPGEQVTVTGTATNLNPKKTPTYSWSGQGLTVGGTSPTSTIDTGSLQPGSYTVTGHVTEGPKVGQFADCTAQFTVKQFEPPTVSCSANPTTVQPGAELDDYLQRGKPAKPSADVQLFGIGRLDQWNREHGDAVDHGSAVGNHHGDGDRPGRQGTDGFSDNHGQCGSAAAAAGSEDADALLDPVRQGQAASDASRQRSQGLPG